MRAVMLAAGDGGRLGAHTADTPKPIVLLNGRPIIEYTLAALAEAGFHEIVIVTGYREAQLRTALGEGVDARLDIHFVTNPRFHSGASLSLRAARAACGDEPFLLTMADHVLSATLVRRLAQAAEAGDAGVSFVAADSSRHAPGYEEEATRLAVDADGFVTAIGKGLESWSALDTGAFVLSPAAWGAVDAVEEDCELSIIFRELARRRRLKAADVSGAGWYDIDTAEDLAAASELLATAGGRASHDL